MLIEWPERGAGSLPPADLVMHFRHAGERREVVAEPRSALGEKLVAALAPATRA